MTRSALRNRTGPTKRLFIATLAAVFCAGLGLGTASAQIPPGNDCWETEPGTKAGIGPLPADFFYPGSDPFPAVSIDVVGVPLVGAELQDCACEPGAAVVDLVWVDIHGDPVAPDSVHAVKQIPSGSGGGAGVVDTCIARIALIPFAGGVGVPEAVPIELVQLHLESVTPITVGTTFGPTQWDVTVTEDGVQVAGTMTLTPAILVPGPAGTMVLDGLPINFRIEFQQVFGPPIGTGTASLGGLSLNFEGSNGTFQSVSVVPTTGPAGPLAVAVVIACGFAWLVRRRRQAV